MVIRYNFVGDLIHCLPAAAGAAAAPCCWQSRDH
jgi:hypothetical protein